MACLGLWILADAFTDLIKALTDAVKQNPVYAGVGLLILCILVGVSFLKPHEILKAWWERRDHAQLDAANDAIEELTELLSWLRLALDVARDSVERVNRIRHQGNINQVHSGLMHLGDWTQRLYGFLEADINKVTLWVPDGDKLVVAAYNGMRPESAQDVTLDLNAPATQKRPFAVLAFHSKQLEICSDRDIDPRYMALSQPSSHPYKSIIAAPLLIGSRCVAVLTVDSLQTGAFDGEDAKQLAQLCASLMALYFESNGTLMFQPQAAGPPAAQSVQ